MERNFFWIVRLFGLLIASISLLVVLVSGYLAFDQYTATANETATPPKVELSKYKELVADNITRESLASERVAENANSATSSTKESDPLQDEIKDKFEAIVSNLNKYAAKQAVSQDMVNEKGLANYLSEQTSGFDESTQILYIRQLAQESEKLSKSAIEEKAIEWTQFLEWFTSEFKAQLAGEQERIQLERMTASQEKAEASITLAFAGGAMLVFMFFTMILVLLRIEINTRKD